MRSRAFPLAPVVLMSIGLIGGCDAIQNSGPIPYRENERVATELAAKPNLRAAIRADLTAAFGADLQHIRVPEDSGLRDGGVYLASRLRLGDKLEPAVEAEPGAARPRPGLS